MKIHFRNLCFAIALPVIPITSLGQGNNNPTGVTGDFNGSVTTGGYYDPFTGNAKRVVTDVTIAGSLGAYPIRMTRTGNSRRGLVNGGNFGPSWRHSYAYSVDIDLNVTMPDGRIIPFTDAYSNAGAEGICPPDIGGLRERLQIITSNPDNHFAGTYDLLLGDGGKVRIQAGRTLYITDPYGLVTTFVYAGSPLKLDKITEPGGRYLKFYYPSSNSYIFSKIEACDGLSNVTQSATYTYSNGYLTTVNYSDGTSASYTYNQSGFHAGTLNTCDDVRYLGPMKKITYEYMPQATGIAVGQLKREKNTATGQVVSEIAYPSENVRVETRGDGPTRTFNYTDGDLISFTDFKGQTSYITYDVNGYRASFKDALGRITLTERDSLNIGALLTVTHPGDNSTVRYTYTHAYKPYYVASRKNERDKTTTYTRDPITNRITRIDYPDGGYETFTYNSFGQVLTHWPDPKSWTG
jgi:YD repeat-containing protein